jgi:DNA-binding transcriptional LysR family regulator
MPSNIDTSLLRAFVTVADSGGMTAAGGTLHLSQGAISQQIKRLELQLECTLFVRDRRQFRLTPQGERLYASASRLLRLNDEIVADMVEPAVAGAVRLGLPHDLVGVVLTPVLRAYVDAFPRVDLSVVCGSSPQLAHALARGDLDLALIEQPLGSSSGECLAVERLVWVGVPGGSAHRRRPLPISLTADTCAFRSLLLDALRDKDIAWRAVLENDNIEATRSTVRADVAVTAWLASTVPADLEILGVDSGLPELPDFSINLHMRHRAECAVIHMADHIRHHFLRSGRAQTWRTRASSPALDLT